MTHTSLRLPCRLQPLVLGTSSALQMRHLAENHAPLSQISWGRWMRAAHLLTSSSLKKALRVQCSLSQCPFPMACQQSDLGSTSITHSSTSRSARSSKQGSPMGLWISVSRRRAWRVVQASAPFSLGACLLMLQARAKACQQRTTPLPGTG